jgi:hypothetical protein
MSNHGKRPCELVPLGEAERTCREKLGMTEARFRHELAEHVRGRGGIPWSADVDAVGVYRSDLEQLIRRAEAAAEQETSND